MDWKSLLHQLSIAKFTKVEKGGLTIFPKKMKNFPKKPLRGPTCAFRQIVYNKIVPSVFYEEFK